MIFSHDIPAFDAKECVHACQIASAAAVAYNLSARRQGLHKGGYAHHGVCNDSAAIIESIVRGKISIFPLTVHGDAAAGVLSLIKSDLVPHLKTILLNPDLKLSTNSGYHDLLKHNPLISEQFERVITALDQIAKYNSNLFPDHSIYPTKIDESIGRFLACTHETIPFGYIKRLKNQLVKI